MAGSDRSCCIPKCGRTRTGDTILHTFPNPDNDLERYTTWALTVGIDTTLDPHFVYKNRRVCHDHFETKFMTRTRRLSPNAVPTLLLPDQFIFGNFGEHAYCEQDVEESVVEMLDSNYSDKYASRGLLHIFPNPEKYPEQHREWVKIVNGRYDPDYDYKKYRVCDRHFTIRDRTRSSRLNVLAIPSQYLTGMPEHAAKFIKEREIKLRVLNTSQLTQPDISVSSNDMSDTNCNSPEPRNTFEQHSTSMQIVAGVSGKMITKRVSSVIAPQLKLSTREILPDFDVHDSNDSTDNISTIDNEEVMEEDFVTTSATIDNNEIIMNEFKHEHDYEDVPVEDSSRAIIARVYNYLQTEYDYMKALVGDICDVSPLANILKRTAEATGVTEDTITRIVEESQYVEQHFNLDHITNSQQSFKEENYVTPEFIDIKKETDVSLESRKKPYHSPETHTIDLRQPVVITKVSNQTQQASNKNSIQRKFKIIKPQLLIRSSTNDNGQKINSSDILKNIPHCQWCIVRQKGYGNNMWICEQCKECLSFDQINKNYQTVS